MGSLKELQQEVEAFVTENDLVCSADVRLLDLQSELGELAKAQLKSTNYGRWSHRDDIPSGWMDELGDVLFSLVALANIDDIDLEDCLKASIKKYKARIDSYGDAGSKKNKPVK
ncbi:MAG: MazG nucleotide pyrophosphohydrolase domain-containing protein [Bdellovibrionales bacterium]